MTSSTALITRDYNGHAFALRSDGWFNITKAAQHFGKELKQCWENAETATCLLALADQIGQKQPKWIEAKQGNGGGTWAHPNIAVFFARWLDVRFAVGCDATIEDILKGAAEVTTKKPEESAVMALPKDYASALRALADGFERACAWGLWCTLGDPPHGCLARLPLWHCGTHYWPLVRSFGNPAGGL